MNIFDNLSNNFSSNIYHQGKSYTYSDLIADVNCFNHLDDKKLVFIITTNSYDFLVGYVSFIRKKIPIALINESMHPELFNNLLDRFKPSYVFSPKRSGCVKKIGTQLLNLILCIVRNAKQLQLRYS